jgi:hypothetical protein
MQKNDVILIDYNGGWIEAHVYQGINRIWSVKFISQSGAYIIAKGVIIFRFESTHVLQAI